MKQLYENGCVSGGETARSIQLPVLKIPDSGKRIRKSRTALRAGPLVLCIWRCAYLQWRWWAPDFTPSLPSLLHAAAGGDQCGFYLFHSGDFGDADLRTFCLRLGLSHRGSAGFLRMAIKEGGSYSEAVSLAAACLCPAHRCSIYVRLAHSLSGFL